MRKSLLTFVFISIISQVKGQFVILKDTQDVVLPRLSVKYVPSHLVSHFPSHVFGLEYLVHENIGIEGRYGYLLNQRVYDYDDIYYRNKSGFKTSALVKFYLEDSPKESGFFPTVFNFDASKDTFRPYFGIELFYNQIQYDRERTYQLTCGNDCDYFSRIEYGITQKRWGGRMQIGFISEIYEPLFLDGSIAFGLMKRDVQYDSRKPLEYEHQYRYNLEEDDTDLILPAADLSLKLVFRILR